MKNQHWYIYFWSRKNHIFKSSFVLFYIHMIYFIFSIDFIFNCNFSLRRILSIRFVWNYWINTPKCWLIKLKILFKLFYMTPSMGHWLVGYFFYLFWCLKWWIMTNLYLLLNLWLKDHYYALTVDLLLWIH